jgi:C-terminal processing protease CtpA/Prc
MDGIETGAEIVRVDGVPVMEYARREVTPYIGASSPQGLEDAVYNTSLLGGARGSSVKVEFCTAAGDTFERTLSRNPSRSAAPSFEFEVLDGRVACIRLNTFMDPKVVTEFENAWDKLLETDFLILDLRANRGGNSGNGLAILKYLLDKPFRDTVCRTRTYRAAWRSWGRNRDWEEDAVFITQPHPTKHYGKPILVLTSAQTGSASEDFLAGLDNARRVTIVGEPTNGSTGNPLIITLPGGGRAGICTRNCRYPDGREFAGIGIQPHVAVRPTIADIRAGRDPVLAAALAHIQSLRGKR